jgi:hypothetical protein
VAFYAGVWRRAKPDFSMFKTAMGRTALHACLAVEDGMSALLGMTLNLCNAI